MPQFFKRLGLTFRIPIIAGIVYFLLSLPFVLNVLTPSIHEGNWYSTFFVILSMPLFISVGMLAESVESSVVDYPDLYTSNMIALALSWVFLILVSMIVGFFIDITRRIKQGEHDQQSKINGQM